MFSKTIVLGMFSAAVALTPASRASADADGLVGGLIGGVVGGVIVNEAAKNRERRARQQQRTVIYKSPTVSSAERMQVRESQVALNYFGFPAGTPDGIRGRNTRNAVSQYQAHMGYPVSGRLTEYERQFLISSYHRAQTGGAATAQQIARKGQGTLGLLHVYRDEAAGLGGLGNVSGGTMAFATGQDAEDSAVQGTALPNLMGGSNGAPSLTTHCSRVNLLTSNNGGMVTQASIADPRFALNEQFCLARTYAITEGESLAEGLQGVTRADLDEQCGAFGPAMQAHIAALSLKPQDDVIRDVSGFILETGMPPAQLSGTAKICLSVGYRTDDMDVALGSALLLTALGERGYAELLGHHLMEGFGASRRPDLALAWYETGIEATERDQMAVFAPDNPERIGVIRKAAYELNGEDGKAADLTGGGGGQPASALPSFNIKE